jgi:hypothetical protein
LPGGNWSAGKWMISRKRFCKGNSSTESTI